MLCAGGIIAVSVHRTHPPPRRTHTPPHTSFHSHKKTHKNTNKKQRCNFFAQADALAYGKTREELRASNVPDYLIPHRAFTGNRPSTSILLPELSAYTVGQLLALYEHQVAVQGFVWNINSFDQWGVELGKVLASRVRQTIHEARNRHRFVNGSDGFNYSTTRMINRYLQGKAQLLYPEPRDVFPVNLRDKPAAGAGGAAH